jgi:probable O-glycosylation ligase (exosortase A-associated)
VAVRAGVLRLLRDLLVTTIILGSVPLIFYRPYIGIIVWTWISLMSPHRLTWGFAYDFPFAKLIGVVTIVAALVSAQRKKWPLTLETFVLFLFALWMLLTTSVALEGPHAWEQWDKVIKIQTLVVVTMMLITDCQKLNLFVWMIVLSLGFYGVKGGIFTVVKGGTSHVLGPDGSFIADNNHLGLALVMVLPLMRYLQLIETRIWVRTGLTAAMVLTGVAVLGTQSRGALLGIVITLGFLTWKSRRRLMLLAASAVVIPIALAIMPESWYERMDTIRTYEQDSSAMGRINAWGFAFNLAVHRPLVGGGFEVFAPRWFAIYAPNPADYHDAHSIYFEVLGEHGFVGLFLFLTLGAVTWRSCSRMIRFSKDKEGIAWTADLARMCQVSLIAYASTGAFVGLAYFDLYYDIIAMVVIAKLIVRESVGEAQQARVLDARPRWSRTPSPTAR